MEFLSELESILFEKESDFFLLCSFDHDPNNETLIISLCPVENHDDLRYYLFTKVTNLYCDVLEDSISLPSGVLDIYYDEENFKITIDLEDTVYYFTSPYLPKRIG